MKRTVDQNCAKKAVDNARAHIGEAYDWHYLPNNDKMYCSELVYESFLTDDKRHLFSARPMNFRDKDGQIPEFWVRLFAEFGELIPEGVLGTNPNDMAQESTLYEVYRMF